MKKLVLTLMAFVLICSLFACGSADKEPAETIDPLSGSIKTEAPKTETKEPAATTAPKKDPPKAEDYDYFHVFKAPEGTPREIVYNYMYAMSQIKWVATESWTTTWKGEGDFGVNLPYEKGKTYYGVPYARTNATLDEFQMYVTNKGTFTPNSPYYEEIIGNHCSSSMVMAYQQVIPMTYEELQKLITRYILQGKHSN